MIKTVGLFELPDTVDRDHFWNEHTKSHARELAERAGDLLRGYVISRIETPLIGEPKFWGMVELWFDDEAARAEFDRRTLQTGVGDKEQHFEDYVRSFSSVAVEEFVVVPPPVVNP